MGLFAAVLCAQIKMLLLVTLIRTVIFPDPAWFIKMLNCGLNPVPLTVSPQPSIVGELFQFSTSPARLEPAGAVSVKDPDATQELACSVVDM
jgi:hypothetical protein